MRKPLLLILLLSSIVFAQSEESDEFEITEPAFEINSSQESLNPDIVPVDESTSFSDQSFDLGVPSEPVQNEDTVLVRTREEPEAVRTGAPGEYVEVRIPSDVFAPYKQRQGDWGFLFSIGAEQTFFPNLLTQVGLDIGDDYTFEEMFGKSGISMLNIELGPKYNTPMGSFAVLAGYATLNKEDNRVTNVSLDRTKSEISFTRYAITMLYYLDTLFTEPYLVPYVGGGLWQANYREATMSIEKETKSITTEPGTQYRFGALLGLDWLEENASRVARKRNGTQGTFLNIYASSTQMAESNADPDFTTDMDLGASLIIEF